MQQVAIYRNLRKNCLSIQSREPENYGKIIGYCKSIFLKRPKFIVREKSRLRVLKEGRKNVHAFIVGECPHFVDKDGNPVYKARAVVVNTNYIQADITKEN